MKLTDVMSTHGWSPFVTEKDYGQLKVYQKDNLLLGVQKIGNVFRIDIQQCIDFGGAVMPFQKILDNQIVPRESLEPALNEILPQLQ